MKEGSDQQGDISQWVTSPEGNFFLQKGHQTKRSLSLSQGGEAKGKAGSVAPGNDLAETLSIGAAPGQEEG